MGTSAGGTHALAGEQPTAGSRQLLCPPSRECRARLPPGARGCRATSLPWLLQPARRPSDGTAVARLGLGTRAGGRGAGAGSVERWVFSVFAGTCVCARVTGGCTHVYDGVCGQRQALRYPARSCLHPSSEGALGLGQDGLNVQAGGGARTQVPEPCPTLGGVADTHCLDVQGAKVAPLPWSLPGGIPHFHRLRPCQLT